MNAISVVCQEPISGTCHESEANSLPYQNSSATGERDLFQVEFFYRSKVDSKMQTCLTAMFPFLSDCESCERFLPILFW